MRARTTTALAALACAFALLPAGTATAGSDAPSPYGQPHPPQTTAPTPQGNPQSPRAVAAGVCSDAKQIGKTGYIKYRGATAASVKQFYSRKCNENYGYLWLWKSYRAKHPVNSVQVGVYSYKQHRTLGLRTWYNTRQHEFWSHGTKTARECTSAYGAIRPLGSPVWYQGYSSKVC